MNIKLSESQKIRILNSDDLYSVMKEILVREDKIDLNREHLWVVGLANNNQILFIELVGLGTVNRVLVEPMEVFSFALQKRAVKIILVHNHTSGELQPSTTDKEVTDQMIQVGRIVKTPVLDHLIIDTQGYFSFKDTGLLQELSKSKKNVPPFELEERIRKQEAKLRRQAIKMAKEKAEREKTLELAREMKRKKYSITEIIDLTHLSEEEIKKLKT